MKYIIKVGVEVHEIDCVWYQLEEYSGIIHNSYKDAKREFREARKNNPHVFMYKLKQEDIKMQNEIKTTLTGIGNYLLQRVKQLESENANLKHDVTMRQGALTAMQFDYEKDLRDLKKLKSIIKEIAEVHTVCEGTDNEDYTIWFDVTPDIVAKWHNPDNFEFIKSILEDE